MRIALERHVRRELRCTWYLLAWSAFEVGSVEQRNPRRALQPIEERCEVSRSSAVEADRANAMIARQRDPSLQAGIGISHVATRQFRDQQLRHVLLEAERATGMLNPRRTLRGRDARSVCRARDAAGRSARTDTTANRCAVVRGDMCEGSGRDLAARIYRDAWYVAMRAHWPHAPIRGNFLVLTSVA